MFKHAGCQDRGTLGPAAASGRGTARCRRRGRVCARWGYARAGCGPQQGPRFGGGDGKRAQGGRGNGVNGVPVHEQGPDIDERYYRVIPGFEKDYSDGENECDYSDYGLASNLLHARKPKLGERVRKATGKYIFVTGVSEDGCSFTADGAEDGEWGRAVRSRRALTATISSKRPEARRVVELDSTTVRA